MISIHILENRPHRLRPTPGYWISLFLNQRRLRDMGLQFSFFHDFEPELYECDVLFISSRRLCPGNTVGHSPETRENLLGKLKELRERIRSIAWFDMADSTGTPQFEVLPYVDRYFKKQLLKDFSLYRKDFYAGRMFADFVHREFGVADKPGPLLADDPDFYFAHRQAPGVQTVAAPLRVEDEHKLAVSWNLGLHDFRGGKLLRKISNQLTDRIESLFGGTHRLPYRRPPSSFRPNDVMGIFQIHSRPIGAFCRERALRILESMKDLNVVSGRQRIPYRAYAEALGNAKVGLSLFGMGEICYREFEIFNAGAALVMQDMSHVSTWPHVYRPGETYMPVRWDLSDLEQTLRLLLGDERKRLALAQAGQENYLQHWSPQGKKNFCMRLKQIVDETRSGRR